LLIARGIVVGGVAGVIGVAFITTTATAAVGVVVAAMDLAVAVVVVVFCGLDWLLVLFW